MLPSILGGIFFIFTILVLLIKRIQEYCILILSGHYNKLSYILVSLDKNTQLPNKMDQHDYLATRFQTNHSSKGHQRYYIQHNYKDYSNEKPAHEEECRQINILPPHDSCSLLRSTENPKKNSFARKLHLLLNYVDENGINGIVSWQCHGRAFQIYNEKKFVSELLPIFFGNIKLSSFRRQLNHYGFERITHGHDKGGYYHQLFLRGMYFLAEKMVRVKVKGTMVRGATSPETEPNFYEMPFIKTTSASRLVDSLPEGILKNKTMNFQQVRPPSFPCNASDVDEYSIDCATLDEDIISRPQKHKYHENAIGECLIKQHFSEGECSVLRAFLNTSFY